MANPLWKVVQAQLESEIENGSFTPGERIPTEEAIAEKFAVHRHTVRRAFARLREKGLIRSEQGKGTFIVEREFNYRIGRLSRLSLTASRSDKRTERVIQSKRKIRADQSVSYYLSLPVNHPVQELKMLRTINDKVVASTICYYPLPRFEGIGALIEDSGSVTEAMKRFGILEFPRKSTSVRAVNPTNNDSLLLGVSKRQPLIELINVNVDKSGVPVQLTRTRLNSALVNLAFDF